MSKNDVLSELNYNKNQLSFYRDKLNELKEQYGALEEFSGLCDSHIRDFEQSISRRKSRLQKFNDLLGTVKSAAGYFKIMDNMLNGSEFLSVVSAIDQLQDSVANKKRNVADDIRNLEEQINSLNFKIENLQYEYDNYPEEVLSDGNE